MSFRAQARNLCSNIAQRFFVTSFLRMTYFLILMALGTIRCLFGFILYRPRRGWPLDIPTLPLRGVTFGVKSNQKRGDCDSPAPLNAEYVPYCLTYSSATACSPHAMRTGIMSISANTYLLLGEALRPLHYTSPA